MQITDLYDLLAANVHILVSANFTVVYVFTTLDYIEVLESILFTLFATLRITV